MPDAAFIALLRDRPLEFKPGTQYRYDNSGYHLLGMVIERVSGLTYGDFVRENILVPLDMHDSGRDLARPIVSGRAAGYTVHHDTLVNASYLEMSSLHGEDGLYSTTTDLLRWDQALYTTRLLSRESLEAMFTPFLNGYGYGWDIDTQFGGRRISHSGRNFGFTSEIARFPDDTVTVIVLSNNQNTDAGQVARDLSAIVFGAPHRTPRVAVPVPRAVLETYTGRYLLLPETVISITLVNDRLYAQASGQGATELVPASETRFYLKRNGPDVELAFDTDAQRRVIGFTMRNGKREDVARRVGDP